MDLEQLARDLQAVAEALDNRVEIWTQVVEADGTLAERIYRGSFIRQPGSPIGEQDNQEPRT